MQNDQTMINDQLRHDLDALRITVQVIGNDLEKRFRHFQEKTFKDVGSGIPTPPTMASSPEPVDPVKTSLLQEIRNGCALKKVPSALPPSRQKLFQSSMSVSVIDSFNR
jgi:hypothetical protein